MHIAPSDPRQTRGISDLVPHAVEMPAVTAISATARPRACGLLGKLGSGALMIPHTRINISSTVLFSASSRYLLSRYNARRGWRARAMFSACLHASGTRNMWKTELTQDTVGTCTWDLPYGKFLHLSGNVSSFVHITRSPADAPKVTHQEIRGTLPRRPRCLAFQVGVQLLETRQGRTRWARLRYAS